MRVDSITAQVGVSPPTSGKKKMLKKMASPLHNYKVPLFIIKQVNLCGCREAFEREKMAQF